MHIHAHAREYTHAEFLLPSLSAHRNPSLATLLFWHHEPGCSLQDEVDRSPKSLVRNLFVLPASKNFFFLIKIVHECKLKSEMIMDRMCWLPKSYQVFYKYYLISFSVPPPPEPNYAHYTDVKTEAHGSWVTSFRPQCYLVVALKSDLWQFSSRISMYNITAFCFKKVYNKSLEFRVLGKKQQIPNTQTLSLSLFPKCPISQKHRLLTLRGYDFGYLPLEF